MPGCETPRTGSVPPSWARPSLAVDPHLMSGRRRPILDGPLMATELAALVDDLVTESAALRSALDELRSEEWWLPTAATGWCLGDHVSHLAYFDETTFQSLVDPDQFRLDAAALRAGGDDFSDRVAAEHRLRSG